MNKERQIIHKIKNKLISNKAIITKADKGNTIVITYQQEYHNKIRDFIINNNLITINDPTKNFQKKIRNVLNECQIVTHKDEKWKYVNLNPSVPSIRGMIKIDKTGAPIRPVINWRNVPAYKLAKMLTKKLQMHIPLLFTFNVKNSVQLMDEILSIPFDPNLQFVSFDINNMYSNVPTSDIEQIIEFICNQQFTDGLIKQELVNMSKIIIEQNYFKFDNRYYSQENGLAMGSPTSSIFSEIYLQYTENPAVYDTLLHNKIMGYFRYVDDILIIYDRTTTDIDKVLESFSKLMPTMKFTMEREINNRINFLDITIIKEHNKLTFDIYRKPTATNSIIPYDSCHPTEHKLAAIRYLTNRMNTYHLNTANKEKERNIIKHILQKNKYDIGNEYTPKKPRKQNTNWTKMGKIHICWKGNQVVH